MMTVEAPGVLDALNGVTPHELQIYIGHRETKFRRLRY